VFRLRFAVVATLVAAHARTCALSIAGPFADWCLPVACVVACSDEEVCAFARQQFGARFLLVDKLRVNDAPGGVAPLYQFLKSTSPDFTGRVSWNFEKFLVGADGTVLRRYKPGFLPQDIRGDILFAVQHPGVPLPTRTKPALGVY
jgi:hypothetical protein